MCDTAQITSFSWFEGAHLFTSGSVPAVSHIHLSFHRDMGKKVSEPCLSGLRGGICNTVLYCNKSQNDHDLSSEIKETCLVEIPACLTTALQPQCPPLRFISAL